MYDLARSESASGFILGAVHTQGIPYESRRPNFFWWLISPFGRLGSTRDWSWLRDQNHLSQAVDPLGPNEPTIEQYLPHLVQGAIRQIRAEKGVRIWFGHHPLDTLWVAFASSCMHELGASDVVVQGWSVDNALSDGTGDRLPQVLGVGAASGSTRQTFRPVAMDLLQYRHLWSVLSDADPNRVVDGLIQSYHLGAPFAVFVRAWVDLLPQPRCGLSAHAQAVLWSLHHSDGCLHTAMSRYEVESGLAFARRDGFMALVGQLSTGSQPFINGPQTLGMRTVRVTFTDHGRAFLDGQSGWNTVGVHTVGGLQTREDQEAVVRALRSSLE